jgi:hypothetical protein
VILPPLVFDGLWFWMQMVNKIGPLTIFSLLNWPRFSTLKIDLLNLLLGCWCCALYNILVILPDTVLAVHGPIRYPVFCKLHLMVKNIIAIQFMGQVSTF